MNSVKPQIDDGQNPAFVIDQQSRQVLNVNRAVRDKLGIESPVGQNFDSLLEAPQDFRFSDPILMKGKWYQMDQEVYDWQGDSYTKVTLRNLPPLSDEPLLDTIRDLIAVLANRLRSPLTAMQGYLDLSTESDESVSSRFGEKFSSGMEQLFEIIDELEELHHLNDEPIGEIPGNSCKPDSVLGELLFEYTAEQRNRIHVQEPRSKEGVKCSKEDFREIMTCLLDNALEHPSGKNFDVHVDLRSPRYIRVANSGKPIDDSMVDKIFLPFTTTKASSMGIGLTKAQILANRHNGMIFLSENSSEKGITFSLCLPV